MTIYDRAKSAVKKLQGCTPAGPPPPTPRRVLEATPAKTPSRSVHSEFYPVHESSKSRYLSSTPECGPPPTTIDPQVGSRVVVTVRKGPNADGIDVHARVLRRMSTLLRIQLGNGTER